MIGLLVNAKFNKKVFDYPFLVIIGVVILNVAKRNEESFDKLRFFLRQNDKETFEFQ